MELWVLWLNAAPSLGLLVLSRAFTQYSSPNYCCGEEILMEEQDGGARDLAEISDQHKSHSVDFWLRLIERLIKIYVAICIQHPLPGVFT